MPAEAASAMATSPDPQRDAGPVHDAAEDVAAKIVRAQPMARRRRLQARVEVLRQWIIRCQQRGQQRDEHRARQDPTADQRETLFAEPPQFAGDV